ncbi:RNA polymerase sigma factor [Caldicellulosiruptoraceae bacterium PP1]
MDEKELVEKAKNDKAAFEQLYEIYFDRIYKYIYHKTFNQHVTEDLTSETFFKILHNINKYTAKDGIPFSAWIFKIASNVVNDYYRKKKNHINIDSLSFEYDHNNQPQDIAIENSQKKILNEALQKLTPEQREVVILRYAGEMKLNEIAKLKNKSDVAIRGLFFRAINSLRDILIKEVQLDEQTKR